jgi:predicted ATPase/class 3 adenylate cyclase
VKLRGSPQQLERGVCDTSRVAELPTGSVTFLFTDIEGSTRRWETDPDGMSAALSAHDEVLFSVVEANGGVVFKHTGDGIISVFTAAQAAVEAAIDAQRRLALPVRMGIASGEAELRNGDYFGMSLNRAARVLSAGHGGQIVVTGGVVAAVRGVEFVDLGTHRLRDLAEPLRLHQVSADGLTATFPPLKTVGAQGNLALQPTDLIGREQALKDIIEQVQNHRLVTLTGAGGVGKTRLAIAVASGLVEEFLDGVWLVELAPVRDDAAVASVVAGTLGIAPRPDVDVVDAITQAIGDHRMLVVLDNCEHVLGATTGLVKALLGRCENVTVVATSREGLRVAGEQRWPVPTLGVDGGVDSEAVALFVERARSVDPGFELVDAADIDAVVAICSGLDGLALAIELAAARMVSMSPQEVERRLGDRFRLLSNSGRGAEHHQTLLQTVMWSYDLLDEDERRLLDRCSVFADGFDAAAATSVCGDESWDEYRVLDLLASLVHKSLLITERVNGSTRYGILETIRQFGHERLTAADVDRAGEQHAAWFAEQTVIQWTLFNGPEQRLAIDWLDLELANLRAAFRWAGAHGDIDRAIILAAHPAVIGCVSQRFEPVGWAEELMPAATAAGARQLPRLCSGAGVCCLIGRPEHAIEYAERALELAADPRYDALEEGWTLFTLLAGFRYTGAFDRWTQLCTELVPRGGLQEVVGLAGLLAVYPRLGRSEEARAVAARALEAAEAFGVPFWIAFASGGYGRSYVDVDSAKAMQWFERSLDYSRQHRIVYQERAMERDIASLEGALGDPLHALELFDGSITFYHRAGNHGSASTAVAEVAMVLARIGDHEQAATVYGASVSFGAILISELSQVLDQLRAELGDATFDECVARGAAMSFDDAVQYVRGEIASARRRLTSAG